MKTTDIRHFIKQHQLPDSYVAIAEKWFFPIAEQIMAQQKQEKKPLVLGINGAQGSGKSTLAELLVFLFQQHDHINAVSISIDDFYYTHQQRIELADQVHPLLLTRGVPGTHDVPLARQTLDHLIQGKKPTRIPRFNKAQDDRLPYSQWDVVEQAVDIIVFEGWCLGAEAQQTDELFMPVNELEQNKDAGLVCRNHVNQQLQDHYRALFNTVDKWIMLKAPSFDCVFNWRLQQENKLRETMNDKHRTMDEPVIKQFIQYYQRITEHILLTLPKKVDYLFELDEQRNIVHSSQRSGMLIFTDMDGSLLDHTTYSHAKADPLLASLQQQHIPVIPVTSKTTDEVLFLRKALINKHPFIVENGAAVFIPAGYFEQQPEGTQELNGYWVKAFVQPRTHWQQLLKQLGAEYHSLYRTFTQLGVSGIIEMTGLDHEAAVRASQRNYGEPLAWKGTEQQKFQFIDTLEAQGAQVLHGGRFMHVSGDCDKGIALQWLSEQYRLATGNQLTTLAIGDSQNDKAMLEQADIALLIRSPVHDFPEIQRNEKTFYSEKLGPEGWVEGVEKILASLKSH